MSQITHDVDGRQIVSARTLCKVLRETGDTLTRPQDFPTGAEWRTGKESCPYCAYDTHANQHQARCPLDIDDRQGEA